MATTSQKRSGNKPRNVRNTAAEKGTLIIQMQFPDNSLEAEAFKAYARQENILTSMPQHGWIVAAARKLFLDSLEARGFVKKPKQSTRKSQPKSTHSKRRK